MGQTIALFPSRLPWKSPPGKSRRGLPKKVVWEAYHWIHRLWALLNFLNDGSPSSGAAASQCIRRASQGQWTALHESYARTMFAKVLSFCSHPRGTMDRGSARLSQLIERIQNSHYDPSISLDEAIGGAMEVNPDRISLPEVAGIIDPMEHLKGDRLVEFETMPSKIPTVKRSSHDPPACHKVSDENWPTVLRKLHAAGMITFIPKSQVLAEGRRLIKGGLFCVPHKDVSDRLINDRRPANLRERRLGWCQLPNGALLSQLILESWESVRASGDDLSNYFYLIQHLESWRSRNCFGRPFRGSLLPEMQLDPQSLYLPAFRVVCMGDTNGVDLAQAVHEAILQSVGCLQPEHTLVHGRIFPCSKTLEGLYIDDHLAFQIVDKKPLRDRNPLQDEVITKKTRARYEELGLPRSLKKAFDKSYNFEAWGTCVDSKSGRVSAPIEKLRQIETLTVALLATGEATKKALQKLVGLYIHPFLHRRECMAIFNHIYLFIEKMPEHGLRKLPHHIKDELACAALLLPVAMSNARWPISIQIAATDASSTGGGRAATITSKGFAKTLYRYGVKKGEYCRLDWDSLAIPPPSCMDAIPEPIAEALEHHSWHTTQSIKFRRKEHINLLEMEMLKQEIISRVNSGRGKCRMVCLNDSRVVVGSYAKGRSSSKQLNHRLRTCLAWTIGGDLSLTNVWVPTDINPADHPSRGRVIPPVDPCRPTPLVLDQKIAKRIQVQRSPGVQAFLQQEAQCKGSDPIVQYGDAELGEVSAGDTASRLRTHAFSKQFENPSQDKQFAEVVDPAESESCAHLGSSSHRAGPRQVTPSKLKFREIFAGKAKLSQAMRQVAGCEVLEPVDYKQGSKHIRAQDILDDRFFRELKIAAAEPDQLWHFGLPCSSFSILQHSNGGTRRKSNPLGNDTLTREIIGNMIFFRTMKLVSILEKAGNYWTLENPKTSYVWDMPKLQKRIDNRELTVVDFDQCRYGLRLKSPLGNYGPCTKPTRIVTNYPKFLELGRICECRQPHVHAVGGVKTKKGWMRRSELAGHYPTPLCRAYSEIASHLA